MHCTSLIHEKYIIKQIVFEVRKRKKKIINVYLKIVLVSIVTIKYILLDLI